MKSQVEEKADITIEGKDIITQWMIRWAAMRPSRFLVGKDGKTAYERRRRRGRKCDIPTEILGEKVWYKELGTKTDYRDKLETALEQVCLCITTNQNSNQPDLPSSLPSKANNFWSGRLYSRVAAQSAERQVRG